MDPRLDDVQQEVDTLDSSPVVCRIDLFLEAYFGVIQGMNVSHHSDAARGADGAVSWVHGFHRSGCVVPSWQSPRFFSKAFLMLRDPLKQSLGDGGDGKMCRPVRLFLQAVTSKVLQSLESYAKM